MRIAKHGIAFRILSEGAVKLTTRLHLTNFIMMCWHVSFHECASAKFTAQMDTAFSVAVTEEMALSEAINDMLRPSRALQVFP